MIYIADFETNGLTMHDIEITQVAYLKVDEKLEIIEEHNKYYYVSNLKDSDKITGLDHETLASLSKGERMTKEEFEALQQELKHGIIIGQNIIYDLMVIDATAIRYELPIVPKYPLDIINQFSPEDTYMKLSWVVDHYMTDEGRQLLAEKFKGEEGFHNALYDIYCVYAIIKYNDKFKERLKNYLKYVPRKD